MKHTFVFSLFALVGAFFITRSTVAQPGYTDAFYYFNAAQRLIDGHGLTDPYLWTYIGLPDDLPTASHQYWMPLTSLIAALGMWIGGDSYSAAQLPFTLMFAGACLVAFWLGWRMGGTSRHAWVAGLLTLFSGFFTRFWGMTDAFAPYALIGSLALSFMGLGVHQSSAQGRNILRPYIAIFLAGVFAGLGHLTRADGLLLVIVGYMVVAFGAHRRAPLRMMIFLTIGYLLVMTPWFVRNISEIGTPLAVGGTQAIWYMEYDDIFRYPPGVEPADLFADGLTLFIDSRWTAFTNNLGTFIAVEGLVVMAPLMLLGLWKRRRERFLWPFALYALGLHVAMTFVFPFPGFRGGLFHSASALVPWWAALGVVGLDDVVNWVAKHRRTWKPRPAKRVFSAGLVLLAVVLSISNMGNASNMSGTPRLYQHLSAIVPNDARLMINDPAQLYYYTGLSSVVLPNAAPHVILEIAEKYQIDYVLIEVVQGIPAVPRLLAFDLDNPPAFLQEMPANLPAARLYAIIR